MTETQHQKRPTDAAVFCPPILFVLSRSPDERTHRSLRNNELTTLPAGIFNFSESWPTAM